MPVPGPPRNARPVRGAVRAGASGARTRITAGEWRGRLIDTPPGRDVRPTTALVRQALFDILGARIRGAVVVDLFAGSGAVAFEALSRGAARAVCIERDPRLTALIGATAARLGCVERLRVVPTDAVRWVRSRPEDLAAAGLVYVDAPYRDDVVVEVLSALGEAPPPALVVCEHHRARALPAAPGGLGVARSAAYGTTTLTFYTPQPDAAPAAPVGEDPTRR